MRDKTKNVKVFNILLLLLVVTMLVLVFNNLKNRDKDYDLANQDHIEENDKNDSSQLHDGDESDMLDNGDIVTNNINSDELTDIDEVEKFEQEQTIRDELENLDNIYNTDYINAIINLEKVSYSYLLENGTITENMSLEESNNIVNNVVMAILRKDRYYDGGTGMEAIFWGTIAGSTDPNVKSIIKLLEADLEGSLANVTIDSLINGEAITEGELEVIHELIEAIHMVEDMNDFIDPVTNEEIDFIHMIASLDSIYTDTDMEDDIEIFVDYLAGWGGDLKTFLPDMLSEIDKGNISNNEEYISYVKETLGSTKNSHFSLEDLLADIDAVNVNSALNREDLLLSEGIIWYYDSRAVDSRYTSFVDSFGSEEDFLNIVYILLFYEIIDEDDISNYNFPLDDLVGVYELFEEFFEHRDTTDDELDALYEGYTELIVDRMNLEIDN